METPSFVIVGAPNFLSRTTLRPRGPSVTLTVSASLFTPTSSARRASSSNFSCLTMWFPFESCQFLAETRGSLLDDGEDVATGQDEQVVAVDGDLGAAVLRVQDDVALLDVERAVAALVIAPPARTDGDDLALLRLLLGG